MLVLIDGRAENVDIQIGLNLVLVKKFFNPLEMNSKMLNIFENMHDDTVSLYFIHLNKFLTEKFSEK